LSASGAPGVADRYTLQTRLRTDRLGESWSGIDQVTGRPVVVTLLDPGLLADEDARNRVRDTAARLVTLRHPGVVTVRAYDDRAGRPTLVRDAADGMVLSGVLAEKGGLEPGRMLDVIAQAGYALQAAHDAGLVHGSLDPAAVVIRADGTVKLTGFAIAGTLGLAPDIRPPEGQPGPAGDVYALGVLGYRMLGAAPPHFFRDAVPNTPATGSAQAQPPGVPAAVAALLADCLAADPARRPAAAEVGRRALALTAAGPDALARQVPPPRQPDPGAGPRRPAPGQRRTRWVLVGFGAFVVIVGFAALRQLAAGSTATVPALVGRPVAAAVAALRHAGFGTRVTSSPARAPAGTVLALRPAAGSVLPKGSTITLRVARPRAAAGPADWRVGRTNGVGTTVTVSAVRHGD
jgi:hypothetical protein